MNRLVRTIIALIVAGMCMPALALGPVTPRDTTAADDADDFRTLNPSGLTLNGRISPANDQDTYYFQGAADNQVTVYMNTASGSGVDPFLLLYRPDGVLLAQNDDANGTYNARITVARLPVTGRYRVVARSFNGATSGAYIVALTNIESDPRTISGGQTITGSISPANDQDTFYFSGTAGQRPTIRMNKTGTSSLDSLLRLYRPDGVLLAQNDDSGGTTNSLIQGVSLPVTGRYRIMASSYGGSSSGNYTIQLTFGGCDPASQYTASYFNNVTLSGTPAVTRCEPWPIHHWWDGGSPAAGVNADNFSVRWTGRAYISEGWYEFSAAADDGIRVWLDGALILNEWRDQAYTTFAWEQYVNAGYHDLRIEYYERGNGAYVEFGWAFDGGSAARSAAPTPESTAQAGAAGAPTTRRVASGAPAAKTPTAPQSAIKSETTNASRGATAAGQKAVQLSQASGVAGSDLTVIGSGFTPNSEVTIVWDDREQPLTTVTVGPKGGFRVSIRVPEKATPGAHTVTVRDGSTGVNQSFRVTR